MSNRPTNDRSGQGGSPKQPSMSLGQVGRDDAPLLIPITPTSTVDEIGRVVAAAGASRVELLVPDNTTALQSIAGNEALREAAKAAGVRVTIFTADEKTTHAARFAKLDVVSVGGTVAAPRPASPRRPTGAQRAVAPPAAQASAQPQAPARQQPSTQPQPPSQQATAQPQAPTRQQPSAQPQAPGRAVPLRDTAREVRPTQQPPMTPPRTTAPPPGPGPRQTPPAQPQRPAPAQPSAADPFLADLNAFDQLDQQEPPRVRQSEQGALLFDVPGDVGVPRPAQNDSEWAAALGDLDSTIGEEPEPAPPPRPSRAPRRPAPADEPRERLAQPGMLGALFGRLPSRTRQRAAADVDDGPRMTRPERTAEEEAARRRQSRNLTLLPLLGLALIVVVVLALLAYAYPNVLRNVTSINAPTLAIAAPLNTGEAEEFTGLVIPLTNGAVADAGSINVQGVLLTAPVTVNLQGTAAGTTVAPIGFAQGSITLRNRSSQQVTIPAGTEVDVNGQRFAFVDTVTVGASVSSDVGITFGAADAVLTARNPGEEGNIPPGTITGVPGYGGTLTVTQPGPFSGGSNVPVQIVAPSDVDALLPRALSQLYGQGVQSLVSQAQASGFALVESPNTPVITPTQDLLKNAQAYDYAVFPPIGQVTQDGSFTLQVSQTFTAVAGPTDKPLDQELQRAAANLIRQQRPDLGQAAIQVLSWRRGDQGIEVDAIAAPPTGVREVPASVGQDIVAEIKGKSRAEAETYLAQLRTNGTIGDFQLPDDWATVPENVKVEFVAPATGSR